MKKIAKNLVIPFGKLTDLMKDPKADRMVYRSVKSGDSMNFDLEIHTFSSRDVLKAFLKKEYKNWGALGSNNWKALVMDPVSPNMLVYRSYQKEAKTASLKKRLHKVAATLKEMIDADNAKREQGEWIPANNRTETPFLTRSGKRLLYCYQPSTGRHAYLDMGTDLILSDEEAQLALGK